MDAEHCDRCGKVVTLADKTPVQEHYHTYGNRTVCLTCSGTTLLEWEQAREQTKAQYKRPGSLNASWPSAKPWPGVGYICPHCGDVLGPHFHFGADVCCIRCSGRGVQGYEYAKARTDPRYLRPGKDHATWPARWRWPFPRI